MKEAKRKQSATPFKALDVAAQHGPTPLIFEDMYSIKVYVEPGDQTDLHVSESIPPPLEKYVVPGTNPIAVSGQFGNFIFQEFKTKGNGPYIWYNHYFLEKEEVFTFFSKQAHLRLQFDLSNNFCINMEGLGEFKLSQGTYNLFFVPFLQSTVKLSPGKAYNTLNIYFRFEHLAHLGRCNSLLYDFLEKVAIGQPTVLHRVSQQLTEKMDGIITEVLNSHLQGAMQDVFLEAQINELLLACVNHHPEGKVAPDYWKEDELEKMYDARHIWLEDIQHPMSLSMLSKRTGINVRKITREFRRLFKCSPYDLLLKARMERADNLLSKTRRSVFDIADELGYRSSQSFAKAFKKIFHETPGQFRKKSTGT